MRVALSRLTLLSVVLAACTPMGDPTRAPAIELVAGPDALPAGTYTHSAFVPPVTFTIDEGWVAGTVAGAFIEVQHGPGTPEALAIQFALVDGVTGAGGTVVPVATPGEAVAAIKAHPGLTLLGESGSRLGGLEGLTVEIENAGTSTQPVLQVGSDTLTLDPGRAWWLSMFDTRDGLVAVMVAGAASDWDRALGVAEPVLESVVIEFD